ncbi:MAG: FAD-dependent oxidoreductase [Candidatus Eremiobacteraeota bacterium]|nr:FAD-dependent oxidoreductase [Candidatus Eremiobacteraeota bacterium]
MAETYELCVIGAGTAGFAAAEEARAEGRRVMLVTGPGDLGGTCILRGCMPAKTLLESTQRLRAVDDAQDVGVATGSAHVDLRAVVRRKRELVDYFAEDRVAELETYPLRRGRARFVGTDTIEVGGTRLGAERFVIATGSRLDASLMPCLSIGSYLAVDDALELRNAPASIAILGGGPVGCEFAQYFSRLGARVTLLQDDQELLRYEDDDIGAAIREALERDGVEVRCGAAVTHCESDGDGRRITYDHDGTAHELRVAAAMLTSGRVPNTLDLDLTAAGIETTEGGAIAVDANLRTTNPKVYAAGDVLGRRYLVHVAEYAGKLAARNAFAATPAAADFERQEAHAIYTQPQVAVAGLTERACRARGLDVTVRRHPFSEIGKAVVSAEQEGFIKMLVDECDRIVGVALLGDDAIDLAGEAITLIACGATTRDVAAMPHLHPTMGEIFARVAERFATLAGRSG